MRVRQIKANMIEVTNRGVTVLYSYETPVAAHILGEGYYRTKKKWSTTTTRHINIWLAGETAEVRPQSFFDNLLTQETKVE